MAILSAVSLQDVGTFESPQPNVEIGLQLSNVAWIILAGSLDLFLVGSEGNPHSGVRYPVFRVEAEHAVFGVGPQHNATRLVAVPTPGTNLLFLDSTYLDRLASSEDGAAIYEMVDTWIRQISSALAEKLVSAEILAVREGQTVGVKRVAHALVPERGVLWLTHKKGRSSYLGTTPLSPQCVAGYMPLTRAGWFLAEPGTVVAAISSEELLRTGQLWPSLDNFQPLALSLLIAKRDRGLEGEQSRLKERAASDQASTDGALWRLAAPIVPLQDHVYQDQSCIDPVFLACQAVGNRLGMRIKPDPNMLQGIVLPDPVAAIAKASGVQIRRVALKDQWWKQDCGPLLAFEDEQKKPVALLPRSSSRYELYDPANRSRVKVDEALAGTLNPFAYCFYQPFPGEKLTGADLLRFGLSSCRRELVNILWMGVAAGLLSMIPPLVTGVIFDRLIPGAERQQLVQMSLILAVVAIAAAMFTLVRSFAMLRLEGKLDTVLQAAYWDRLLNLPVPFFRNYSSGDLAVRSLAIAQIRQTLTGSTVTAVLSGIFSVFSFALLFYYSWRMALLATVLVGFAFLVSIVCGYAQMSEQRGVLHLRGILSGRVLQMIDGFAKFRVSGTERRAFAFWAREFSQQKLLWAKVKKISTYFTVFNAIFPTVSLGAIFCYHSYLIAHPDIPTITTGSFLAFLAAYTQFLTAALLQSTAIISVISIIPIYERARPILETIPEVNESKGTPGKLSGAIEISHVSFRYRPDSPPVLRDISLQISAGEYVAFVGSSGSGKSTLLRLLLGFEKPESGAIYYDGQDMDGLDLQAVRKQIGVVLQASRLISGNIFMNIVGTSTLTIQDAWDAARLAGMEKDIKQMPMGLHTMVSDGGGGLSGGQRQRLMIARAVVSRPRMLFFDEATSALDNRTQAVVSQSLESFQATRVVIAHRLSTIMNADRIYVMDKGTIVQSGSYAELLEQKGPFAELAKRQVL